MYEPGRDRALDLSGFNTRRPGGAGCNDVYKATRSTTTDGFGTPVQIAELNTAECEWVTWVSADGCQVALTRRGTPGGYDLYLATKP